MLFFLYRDGRRSRVFGRTNGSEISTPPRRLYIIYPYSVECESQEGYGDGVTLVALAFLPSAHPSQISLVETWPWYAVNQPRYVALSYNSKSLSLRVEGQHRRRATEPFRYGGVDPISRPDLENTTIGIFKQYMNRNASFESHGISRTK